jgi:hypothetical protein
MLRMAPGILYSLQCATILITLIKTSCIYLSFVKPFCDLEKIVLLTVFSRLFKALEITLIDAVLKDLLSVPVLTQCAVYRCRGFLKICQNFFIKQLLRPSIPEALLLPCDADLSSSSMERGASSLVAVASEMMLSLTRAELMMSCPKNSLMQFGLKVSSHAGLR